MERPHILVHEYVSGGGWPSPELPPGLRAEGLAMLRAVLLDLEAWGGVEVTTTLDRRWPPVDLPARRLVPLDPERYLPALRELARECSAALLIAPETGGVLARLSREIESLGVPLLGASARAVSIAGDKWQCYQLFRQSAIPTPETRLVTAADALGGAAGLEPPWVVKPRDGAGAEGVHLVAGPASLGAAETLARLGLGEWLLQPYIAGVPASVSLLCDGREALPLSLNEQHVDVGAPFRYRGGRIPLCHPLAERALALARQVVGLIPGLRGYVGIDLVLTAEECAVVDVNPRITTSYVGLRRVLALNLAQAMWEIGCQGRLPSGATLTGSISFAKDGTLG